MNFVRVYLVALVIMTVLLFALAACPTIFFAGDSFQ